MPKFRDPNDAHEATPSSEKGFMMDSRTNPVTGADKIDAPLLRIAGVIVLGAFMSILDTTIINVAIRDLSKDFHVSLATTQWISTGYMLALATVIPLTGWAADRFGTKRLYMTSILLFLVGSALSGAAWSMSTLILFRVLQGLGGGMIMPAGMTILSHAAGPRRMGRLMGLVGVPMLLGPILGPVLGGWLVDDVSWRWIFFVNLPVGAIALYAAGKVLQKDEGRPHHLLDWKGMLLISPGLAIFVFGLARIAASAGPGDFWGDACAACGLMLVSAFIIHAFRHKEPLIDVRIFASRTVGSSAFTSLLFSAAFFGTSLLVPLYFQLVRSQTAFGAGFLMSIQGVGALISMPLSAWLTDKFGAGRVVLCGLSCLTIAMLSLTQIGDTTPLWIIEPTLFLIGMGMGSTMMPSMSAAMASLQRHQIARVTSGLNVIQRVGSSIGTALLSVVLAGKISAQSRAVDADPAGHSVLPAASGHAFGLTFHWSLAMILLAFCAALFLPRGRASGGKAPVGVPPTLE